MRNKVEKRTLELIQQAEWGDIVPRLMKYALTKLSIRSRSPLEGHSIDDIAHDIVYDSIKKVIEGKRQWDPDRGSLLNFLMFSVIRSDISHLYKSDYYDATQRLSIPQDDGDMNPISRNDVNNNIDRDGSAAPDKNILDNEMRDSIFKAVEGDDELSDIVLCMYEGIDKPEDIANQLNVDVKVIYNARKRLRRIYKDILPKKK